LVERFVYTEDVGGSSPSSPTKFLKEIHIVTSFQFPVTSATATETATDISLEMVAMVQRT
jgi:hypothetical protein